MFSLTRGTLAATCLGLVARLPAAAQPGDPKKGQPPKRDTRPVDDPDGMFEALERVREKYGVPAISAAVVIDGRVVAASAAGRRKSDDPTPIHRNDRFLIGSVSKPVSRRIVGQLLQRHGYRQRQAVKKVTMGSHPDRNAQCENITRLKSEYQAAGLPMLSIDTKKKELPGNFHRDGVIATREPIAVNGHDCGSHGVGKLIPHGLYDVGRNQGFVHLNTSHDTSELACDGIATWWGQHGRERYPGAKKLLLLCDGGGSNRATQYLFKEDLHELSNRLGLGFAWPTTLRTVRSTTRSSTVCSPM